jgi:hypothetical protein
VLPDTNAPGNNVYWVAASARQVALPDGTLGSINSSIEEAITYNGPDGFIVGAGFAQRSGARNHHDEDSESCRQSSQRHGSTLPVTP